MGELAERLDRIRVRANAAGVELEAELRGRNQVTLTFGESVYEFVERVAETTPRLIQHFQAEVTELKTRYYG